MQNNGPAPTKEERDRMERMTRIGCLPCLLVNFRKRLGTVQHVVEGGKRLGHSFTYSACEYHHMAIPGPYGDYEAEEMLGPSLALNKKAYAERFGSERELVELQDVILALPVEETYRAIRWYKDKQNFVIPQKGTSR